MPLISLQKLHADPRNSNVCDNDILDKLKRNIEKSNFCPTLLVRPHPEITGDYIIVDGHHRKQIIEDLDWQEVDCQIKAMTDEEAGLLLLTLNRLRGVDNPRLRAELIESLLPHIPLEDLTLLLPESSGEIKGLLALLKLDEIELLNAFQAQIEAEQKTLPVPFGFMVPAEDTPIIHEALACYKAKGQKDTGYALVAICRDVLSLQAVGEVKHE